MEFLKADDLLGYTRINWGLVGDPSLEVVQNLILHHEDSMRRIYHLLYLTRDDTTIRLWLRQEILGLTPLKHFEAGTWGMRLIEAVLVMEFCRAAPPELFPSAGAVRDTESEVHLLRRLMGERNFSPPMEETTSELSPAPSPQPGWAVHDPVPDGGCDLVLQPTLKIARAITRLSEETDGESFRDLLSIAAGDQDDAIRTSVIKAAVDLIGYPAMADLLAMRRDDPNPQIREEALSGLVRFAEHPEMHNRIAPFAHDDSPEIRRMAIEALIEKKLDPAIRKAIMQVSVRSSA